MVCVCGSAKFPSCIFLIWANGVSVAWEAKFQGQGHGKLGTVALRAEGQVNG